MFKYFEIYSYSLAEIFLSFWLLVYRKQYIFIPDICKSLYIFYSLHTPKNILWCSGENTLLFTIFFLIFSEKLHLLIIKRYWSLFNSVLLRVGRECFKSWQSGALALWICLIIIIAGSCNTFQMPMFPNLFSERQTLDLVACHWFIIAFAKFCNLSITL